MDLDAKDNLMFLGFLGCVLLVGAAFTACLVYLLNVWSEDRRHRR